MELKKAVAELRENLEIWKSSELGWIPIASKCAIPVAETLLATLEGVDKPAHTTCRYCGQEFDRECPLCRTAPGTGKPAERPPEKGDWVTESFMTQCHKVVSVSGGKIQRILWTQTQQIDDWLSDRKPIIVRRAADRLRVGDKVAFGSKEGELRVVRMGRLEEYFVRFPLGYGWFDRKDLTLLEPVYDRPAEKGDC